MTWKAGDIIRLKYPEQASPEDNGNPYDDSDIELLGTLFEITGVRRNAMIDDNGHEYCAIYECQSLEYQHLDDWWVKDYHAELVEEL